MAQEEFAEQARLYAKGAISRRKFLSRVVAGGASLAAASALVQAVTQPAGAAPRITLYGFPDPPGQGGTPPGQGGTPPGLSRNPPGLGGTPPGKGGTPPGKSSRGQTLRG